MKPIALVVAGMAAATLLSPPVFAAKVALSDEALDTVFGAANTSLVGGVDNTTVSATNANGNIQVASYQWDDDHSSDSSSNKGANVQSGDYSQVQQNASVVANALAWGTVAQSVTINSADIGHDQKTEAWAVMFIGGF